MKKIYFLYVITVLFSSKYAFAEEYKFEPDLSRNKPKTAPYSFVDKKDEIKTVAKKVQLPKTKFIKHDWYAHKIPPKAKNYFNFSLNAGYGKLDSTLFSNKPAILNGQEIKISSTYTKTTNFSYGFQASYLRAISDKFRVGTEINFTKPNSIIQESQVDGNGVVTKARFNSSSGLNFAMEYDLVQYEKFSLFVNAGVGVAINSINLIKEVPISSESSEKVMFTVKNRTIVTGNVGSGDAHLNKACEIVGQELGYTKLTNSTHSNNNIIPNKTDYKVSPDKNSIEFGGDGITCRGTAVSKKIGTEERTVKKMAMTIPFNVGIGTYYEITDNILWTTRLNYYNMGNINVSATVDNVEMKATYKTFGNVVFSSGITYRF